MNCECDLRTKLVGDGCHICNPDLSADIAADNRKDTMLMLLRRLEWSGIYSYCTGWPCCPICNGVKPEHGGGHQGHMASCKLGQVLSAQEIEQ